MKRILSVLLALALCLCLFACGKPEEPPVQPTQPNVTISTCPPAPTEPPTEPTTEAPTEPEAPAVPEVIFGDYSGIFGDSSGDITYVRMEANLPHMEALPQIHGYYQTLWEDLKATYELSREDAARHKADLESMGQEFTPWAVEITFDVTRNDGVTLSVLREVYENLGGAHPMITYRAENFDVATQGRLLLGDLFTVSEDEYSPRLRDMILPLMDQKETESGVLYFEFAREQLMTLLDPMDFALTEDALLIFYNEYAIAPHAAGLQHFYLPLADLADILKPQYLVK